MLRRLFLSGRCRPAVFNARVVSLLFYFQPRSRLRCAPALVAGNQSRSFSGFRSRGASAVNRSVLRPPNPALQATWLRYASAKRLSAAVSPPLRHRPYQATRWQSPPKLWRLKQLHQYRENHKESVPMSAEWEFHEFVWTPPTKRWVMLDDYNHASASQKWWQDYRSDILSQLQSWLSQGWEPVGNVGPECWQLNEYRKPKIEGISSAGCVIAAIVTFTTFGLFLLYLFFAYDYYLEPIGFRVPMRRRKR